MMKMKEAFKVAKTEAELFQLVENKPLPKDTTLMFLSAEWRAIVVAFWYFCRQDARGLALTLGVTPPNKWTVIKGQAGFYGPWTQEDCLKVLETSSL